MTKRLAPFFGFLVLGTLFSLAAGSTRTFKGVITDSMCGADHTMMHVTPDTKCVLECAKAGSKYALLVGKNVYVLSDQKTPAAFAAQTVKVTGVLDAKTRVLQVQSIELAK